MSIDNENLMWIFVGAENKNVNNKFEKKENTDYLCLRYHNT